MSEMYDTVLTGVRRAASKLKDTPPVRSKHGFDASTFIGDQYVYKAYPAIGGRHSGEFRKEPRVIGMLNERLSSEFLNLVPKECFVVELESVNVAVQTRLVGESGLPMGRETAIQLSCFLSKLHEIELGNLIDEFEEDRPPVDFIEYVSTAPAKFVAKIMPTCDSSDASLLEQCLEEIRACIESAQPTKPYVLLHKDITVLNILQKDGDLSGVVDWSAAQSGPPEWEMGIVRQRLPEMWHTILGAYDKFLDRQLMKLCGLVQSLRFWKSYPTDNRFSEDQRRNIVALLRE